MSKRGIVSNADNVLKKATVIIPELDNIMIDMTIAKHIGELTPGDIVVAEFISDNKLDGVIIAELR